MFPESEYHWNTEPRPKPRRIGRLICFMALAVVGWWVTK